MAFDKLKNDNEAKGTIWYGIHFYPGVAQYKEDGSDPYCVFLCEDTLRKMDPTFAGCPVFVLHVDDIETDLDTLRAEADGWVSESFFNQADGKHWVKFVAVSEKANRAISQGYKLSNCYMPKTFGSGGTWNGVDYKKEITDGVYEHLALVPNPRYEESIILSPEDFKKYNLDKLEELKKVSNAKKEEPMKFNFFKKTKVENSLDLEIMSVMLPRSKSEVNIAKLINDADEAEMHKDEPKMAHPDHHVEVHGEKMPVHELINRYKDAMESMEEMKKHHKDDDDSEMKHDDDDDSMDPSEYNDDEEQDMEYSEKKVPESEDDKRADKKALVLEKEEEAEVKDAKKKNAAAKASRLRNAHHVAQISETTISLMSDQIARGKQLFGSGK